MDRRGINLVYKYFDLTDEFVRVRTVNPAEVGRVLRGRTIANRAAYRRLVLETCIVGWSERIEERLRRGFPGEVAAAEEVLFQLCVDVNPALDIHQVQLPVDASDPVHPSEPARDPRWIERARDLEDRLRGRIVGQGHALRSLAHRIRKHAAGLSRPDGPIGAFLLVGNTGVGKTAVAKALAELLFDDPQALVRLDGSEFAAGHEYSKLIGAPPGYVGHEDGGQLTEALRRPGGKVVLFDEIEKAHPRMHQVLLQAIDEGRLTDGRGSTASFRETLVLLTSNLGTAELLRASEAVGFGGDRRLEREERQGIVDTALRRALAPEFLARLDEVLVFDDLGPPECREVVRLEIAKLRQRLRGQGYGLSVRSALVSWMADQAWSPRSGARHVARVVARSLEDPIADLLLAGAVAPGGRLECGLRRGSPHVSALAARSPGVRNPAPAGVAVRRAD